MLEPECVECGQYTGDQVSDLVTIDGQELNFCSKRCMADWIEDHVDSLAELMFENSETVDWPAMREDMAQERSLERDLDKQRL